MEKEQKERLFKIIKKAVIVLLIGIMYLVFVRLTGIGVPCLLMLVIGGYCPGCGITRMFIHLSRFDFALAFRANALLMTVIPMSLPFIIRRLIQYVKNGESKGNLIEKIFVFIVFTATVAFWIMRNMDAFSFLAPV